MTETPIAFAVRAALVRTGRVVLWRNNSGVTQDEQHVRYGLGRGSPDLVGLLVGSARFVGFEVKSSTGRVSKHQRTWHAAVRAAGGFVAVVRSPEAALEALARAEAGGCE